MAQVQPRILSLKGTVVLEQLLKATTRFVALQGGSRSSKSYSLMQMVVIRCFEKTGRVITIARKTLPALRGSMMRDFFDVLNAAELYDESSHNKSELTYKLNGNTIEFVSADQSAKIRGRKRNILIMNEATEFDPEDLLQFAMRTTEQIFLDYNPDAESYIYDTVLTRDDVTLLKSTYKDNPFLEPEVINEIERLEHVSPEHWVVFGMGERGISSELIMTNWRKCDKLPPTDDISFGLDFGFNHPCALVETRRYDGEIYVEELIYESKLTGADLIQRMSVFPDIKKYPIYSDGARPELIEELNRAGFKAVAAVKDVKDGIDYLKRHIVHVTKSSVNLWKERGSYKWMKDKQGRTLEEPVKFHDDGIDATRYSCFSHYKATLKPTQTYITKW